MLRVHPSFLAFVLWTACAAPASAVEPWADVRLTVTEGLAAWFDAAALAASDAAASGVGAWPDASGRGRALRATSAAYQPQLIRDAAASGAAMIRFDGVDDHLADGDWGTCQALTILAVVRPRSNAGEFRGLLSAAAPGQNDYVTGLNVDLGPSASEAWNTLNVEAASAGGMANLAGAARPFGEFHLVTLVFEPDTGIRAWFDGQPSGERAWNGGTLNLAEVTLGARRYRNEPGPAYVRGFFEGDLAELLIYEQALGESPRTAVEQYLLAKHAALLKQPAEGSSPFQMLQPGFRVETLPLELTNVNDLAYDDKGRLWLLGYDGKVHVARDRDGDGLEETLETFWDRPTIVGPLAMCLRPDGVYVTSRGKISRLRDTDGNGQGDEETVVVSDWQPADNFSGGVDALGMAFDAQGRLHFALGCADFTNAYRLRDGRAHYDLASERGTVLRVEPDGRRTILATGVRFAVALAFNRRGDLFGTDQEGETWLPGGNPLDELLHIQSGRHYGFPPRHDEHLPRVVDTPATALYGPQHQSTCGLTFNETNDTRRAFGPAFWEGDALVSGYSRGKLWRTKLARQAAGYVSQTQLIASARMLLIDAAISPAGDLVAVAHSGQPDWGRGPTGPATLWKVRYAQPETPQPLLAWATSPIEVRVAFDRPLPEGWVAAATIESGEHVRAADRLEYLRPGYESVQRQQRATRHALAVRALGYSHDRRELILTTDPHTQRAHYALTLQTTAVDQPPIDLDYELTGVELRPPKAGNTHAAARGWWPHPDRAVAAQLGSPSATRSDAELDDFMATTVVEPIAGADALLVHGDTQSVDLRVNGQPATWREHQGAWRCEIPLAGPTTLRWPARAVLRDWEFRLSPALVVPAPLAAFRLPWEPPTRPATEPAAASAPTSLAGGDWQRGRALFYSPQAQCGGCHRVRGEGATIGPDLSNLVHRDAVSVTRDVVDPNAAINPDYVPLVLHLRSGETVTGLARPRGAESLIVFDSAAKEREIATAEIEDFAASATSIMPTGMADKLGAAAVRDLVTFLTEPEPRLPDSAEGHEPPLRTREEITQLHAAIPAYEATNPRPLNLVLLAGPKDHGPGEHDYPRWQREWRTLLAEAPGVRVSTAHEWPSDAQFDLADVLVCYLWNHDWSAERYAQLDRYLARGGGLVLLHAATIADQTPEKLAERVGIAFQPGTSRYRHGLVTLDITPVDSPLTRGLRRVEFVDETYWKHWGDAARTRVLATAVEEGETQPIVWTFETGRARVFGCVLGHFAWTFDDPVFRTLVLRGIAWAAREPESRLQPLAISGVRWKETQGAGGPP